MRKSILMLAAIAAASALADVQTARLGALGRNDHVVTNATFEAPGDYANVSNRAMQISMPGDEDFPPDWFIPIFKGRADYAISATRLEALQSPYALTLNDGRWGMRHGYTQEYYQYFPFAYKSEVDAATNAIPRNFLPLTGGTMEGTVYFEPDEGLVFGDYIITDGSNGDGAGIYRYSDDGYETWMLFGQFPTNGLFRVDDTSTLNYKGKLWGDDFYSIYLGFPFDACDVNYWLPPQTDGTGYPADVHLASTSYVDRAIAAIPVPSGTPEWSVENQNASSVSYVTNGMAQVVFTGAALGAVTNGWPDGASVFVRVGGVPQNYTVGANLRLVGYGTWPTNDFQSVWWRSGAKVYINVITED